MGVLEAEVFQHPHARDHVTAAIILSILGAVGVFFGVSFMYESDKLYAKIDMKNEKTNSYFRYLLIINGLLIDILALGLIPLIAATKIGMPAMAIPGLTVQDLFPSFALGGIEERLVLYCFLGCGVCRLFAGLGMQYGNVRVVDFVAMLSYGVELAMVLIESQVFKTTTFGAVLGAVAILLRGQLQAYTCDALSKKAKVE